MILVGVVGISLSSIFVKYSAAPSAVTAAWRLLWTVILLVFNVLAAIGIWLYWILIGWIAFGLVGYINAWIFDRIFRRYYPQEEA